MAFFSSGGVSPETPALTLGEALAILAVESRVADGNHGQAFAGPAESYLQGLRERAKTLRSSENLPAIFKAVPAQRCEMEKTFLAENEDFFLAYFLVSAPSANGGAACWDLFKHLNDCFECFEEFSSVMQNYYHKFQELSNRPAGT